MQNKQKIIKKHYPLSQNSFGHLNNFRLLHKSITLNIYIYWIDFALMLAVISRIIHISMCVVKHGCLEKWCSCIFVCFVCNMIISNCLKISCQIKSNFLCEALLVLCGVPTYLKCFKIIIWVFCLGCCFRAGLYHGVHIGCIIYIYHIHVSLGINVFHFQTYTLLKIHENWHFGHIT